MASVSDEAPALKVVAAHSSETFVPSHETPRLRADTDHLSEGHFVLNSVAVFSLQRRYLSVRLVCRNPDDPNC